MTKLKERTPPPPRKSDKVGLGALGALVVGLAFIVWLALPKDGERSASDDAGAWAPPAERDAASKVNALATGALERLPLAASELAVLTAAPDAEVERIATPEAVAKLLGSPHCGGTCDALRAFIADHDHFELQVMRTADYILPPKDSYATIAAGLTPAERATIDQRPTAVVIRTHGPSTIDQLPARAGFATTAALAEALSGLVYDEVVRRIEAPRELADRVITVPLGQNVFRPRQISVQLYRQEDGTARLLTLGMVRFGSPDFMMRGAAIETGPALANVLNAAASWAAGANATQPIVVTLADVARVVARPPETLAKDPTASRPVMLGAIDAERTAGDPENDMLELVPRGPPGEDAREAWARATTDLFGVEPQVVFAKFDAELDAIAARARKDLPGAVKRFEAGEGKLYVKGPFPIPEASRMDGGATEEWMWIRAASCDAHGCLGMLSNTPGYATNLAPGKTVSVARERTADWMLVLEDGGTAGGESIKVLQKRAR